jgi:hypothetical protein
MTAPWNSTPFAVATVSPPLPPSHNVVTRELRVLRTLAHVGWLTTEQLHALCFPSDVMATVRTTLRQLEQAGWICHARWRIKSTSGSNVWGIGYKGPFILSRYGADVPPNLLNLTRPSTAMEHEEWFVCAQARLLLVRLVLNARCNSLLCHIDVRFADTNPARGSAGGGADQPDALLAIAWTPPVVHTSTWLPWLDPPQHADATRTVRYACFFARSVPLAAPASAPLLPQGFDACGADHVLVVVPRAAQVEQVHAALAQHQPSVVVLAWHTIAPQIGTVLRNLHRYGQQASLFSIGACTHEQ